jgi:hypothetical protein
MDPMKPPGAGVPREELQGKLQDPTGTDPDSTGDPSVDDQHQTKGGEGKEGGAAGKFERGSGARDIRSETRRRS